ncbi:LuxR family transcriptional regulator [Frankia sp. CcI49]|uniref:LuxR C-terminal-related transcriptional regulator n=1 Tax=unclassified Frankia TaxID=2632575 RepID=UPI0006CA2AE4|nr:MULTISPECIES: response regulator transcription factor [unclassified Frankia]KPM56532.1 LuxR family transcriptional regulator [Frankia sp. R43]ONH62039.1 LuxR family transcriptional regulator [Frankia sp. CcI49]
MRVALAEDGALFREGLLLLLGAAGHQVVGSVADGDALMGLLGTEPADVAILDIRMPPGTEGGLRAAARVRAAYPETGLLLLSHYAETHYLMRCLEIGTERIGYRLKERVAGTQVLSDTLDRINAGELVIEPSLAGRLVNRPAGVSGPLALLSQRELEVLRLMAEGRSNAGIAGLLSLSAKAVEKHIASIFTKLDLPFDATTHHRRVLAVLTYLGAR